MISFAFMNSLILMGNLKEWYNSSSCIIVGCMCWAAFFVQFVFASCTLGCGQPAFIFWSFAFMTSNCICICIFVHFYFCIFVFLNCCIFVYLYFCILHGAVGSRLSSTGHLHSWHQSNASTALTDISSTDSLLINSTFLSNSLASRQRQNVNGQLEEFYFSIPLHPNAYYGWE